MPTFKAMKKPTIKQDLESQADTLRKMGMDISLQWFGNRVMATDITHTESLSYLMSKAHMRLWIYGATIGYIRLMKGSKKDA